MAGAERHDAIAVCRRNASDEAHTGNEREDDGASLLKSAGTPITT
jgi:hypothetical protein